MGDVSSCNVSIASLMLSRVYKKNDQQVKRKAEVQQEKNVVALSNFLV